MRIPITPLLLAGLLAGPTHATAQWMSVGSSGAPTRTGQTLTWQTPQAVIDGSHWVDSNCKAS